MATTALPSIVRLRRSALPCLLSLFIAGPSLAVAAPVPKPAEPFAFADFTWLTGNPRTKDSPLDTKVFTGEFRVDANYTHAFHHPQDNTIVGSSEIFRAGELQLTQLGIGGDFHWENVRGRSRAA